MNYNNRSGHKDFLVVIALMGLTVGSLVPLAARARMSILYQEGKKIAATQFGDKIEPLTDPERDLWYESMGVRDGETTSHEQLRKYYFENR